MTQEAWEMVAAQAVGRLLRREYGLSPDRISVRLCPVRGGDVLTVRLEGAVSPVGRLLLERDGGEDVLRGAYAVLHDLSRARADALVSELLGRSVRHSAVTPDGVTGDVLAAFVLTDSCHTDGGHDQT